MGCIALVRCVLVLRCGLAGVVWCGIRMQAEAFATSLKRIKVKKTDSFLEHSNRAVLVVDSFGGLGWVLSR